MYSGSDSTESLQNQNWPPINPLYPSTPNDQVDWAALAQQWIIMKEAGPPVPEINPPSPPPPPNIHDNKKDSFSIEGGEAPMEVENEKDDAPHSQWNNEIPPGENSWNWNQQQPWGYSWNAPVASMSKAPLLPTPGSFNHYSTVSPEISNLQYNNKTTATEYSGGYWTASGNKQKPHNKRFSKVNLPQKHSTSPAVTPTAAADAITLDANRRKQLPAWIRDGLEKMERDKIKQLEKEKVKQEIKEEEIKPKFNQKEALEIIKSTVKEREKSKFDSDGEDSNSAGRVRFKKQPEPEPVMISFEEMMLRIRKTMTEILLKVTNQEILAVCKEEMQRRLRKRKASDRRVSASSGNNLSAKLGVGIYGESGSSSDDSGSESSSESVDSEADLKAAIRRRKADFVKTEREIEERLAATENPTDDGERAGTPDIHQSQVDSKSQDRRLKLGNVGVANSPKYSTLKQPAGKTSSSNSSASDSDSSDKRYDSVQSRRLSNSENISQRYTKDDTTEVSSRNSRQKSRTSGDSYSRSRRSRSKSNSSRRNRSRSRDRHQDYRTSKHYKRSRSPSSSRSYRSTESNSKRSDSYSKGNNRSRRSRSHSRSRYRQSHSSERSLNKKSRSRRKSRSVSPDDYYRRSRSRSSSRGKRSRRR